MNRKDIESVVDTMLRARLARDVDTMVGCFAPDASFGFPGQTPTGSLSQYSNSREQVRAQLTAIVSEWNWKSYELLDLVVEGDRAVAVVRQNVAHARTGAAAIVDVVDVMRFANGKLSELLEFVDTARAATLSGKAA